jgi:NAD(P)H-hydrate repair Nnr-like enzyme with NAD(P)H-hydrate dehydratase domain
LTNQVDGIIIIALVGVYYPFLWLLTELRLKNEGAAYMEVSEVTKDSLIGVLPKRKEDSHKGDYGRLLLLCGSVGFTGAPWFAAEGAVKSGAGLVFLGVPRDIYDITAVKCNEAMPFPLPSDENGRLSEAAEEEILERLGSSDACLIGPGLGRSESVSKIDISQPTQLILFARKTEIVSGHCLRISATIS